MEDAGGTKVASCGVGRLSPDWLRTRNLPASPGMAGCVFEFVCLAVGIA